MRFFVTGGTGFIGSHFIKLALAEGHEVTAIRRPEAQPRIQLPPEVKWIEGSLETIPSSAMKDCEAVIHLAAHGVNNPSKADWKECYKINVAAFIDLVTSARKAGIFNFTIAGSCFEYGRTAERYDFIPCYAPLEPTGPYHASKAAASMAAIGLATSFNLKMTILRPFHVYGEGEEHCRLWTSLKSAAAEGKNLDLTAGEQIRDFITVEEVARQFLLHTTQKLARPGIATVANLGTGKPNSVKNFAENLWQQLNAEGTLSFGKIPYRDNEIMRYVPEVETNDIAHL